MVTPSELMIKRSDGRKKSLSPFLFSKNKRVDEVSYANSSMSGKGDAQVEKFTALSCVADPVRKKIVSGSDH